MELIDWKNMSFEELKTKYSLSQEDIYEIAITKKFYKYRTVIERRKLMIIEKEVMIKNTDLKVSELANLFHKSYNAMLIYVKTNGLYDRIGKK